MLENLWSCSLIFNCILVLKIGPEAFVRSFHPFFVTLFIFLLFLLNNHLSFKLTFLNYFLRCSVQIFQRVLRFGSFPRSSVPEFSLFTKETYFLSLSFEPDCFRCESHHTSSAKGDLLVALVISILIIFYKSRLKWVFLWDLKYFCFEIGLRERV